MILSGVIIAPVVEEILFRKFLLENLLPYGVRKAVLASGILFGVLHIKSEQIIYSIFVGIIFGVVVVKTGKVKHAIYMHMITSLLGAIVIPMIPADGEMIFAIVLVLAGLVSAVIEMNLYIRKRTLDRRRV